MIRYPMLTVYDLLGASLSLILLWILFSSRIKRYSRSNRELFIKAFWFKMFCSVVFSMITAFYYRGSDSEMFLYAVRDMKLAIDAGDLSFTELWGMEQVGNQNPLAYYFQQDNYLYPVFGFMQHSSNFLVPKLGIAPFYIFFSSYLAMCFVFSFFALAGTIRLYKLFAHYFPKMQREAAIATLFLPSACYWSAGFLKDPICFGSVGFLLYGLFNFFIRRKHRLASLMWIALSVYFLYTAKVYILLALIPGIAFWLFGEISSGIKKIALKRAVTFLSLIVAGIGALLFVNYLTSESALSKFSLDNLLESSDYSRKIFERRAGEGSNFQIATTNPALLLLNGFIATFFRPFPWEVNSFIVLFSAAESLIFLSLLVYLFYKKGFGTPFKKMFDSPLLILSFSFAIIFAVTVGISTTNFGSLSRYKIPCLPFYLMFIFGAYHLTGLAYPRWVQRILSLVTSPRRDSLAYR